MPRIAMSLHPHTPHHRDNSTTSIAWTITRCTSASCATMTATPHNAMMVTATPHATRYKMTGTLAGYGYLEGRGRGSPGPQGYSSNSCHSRYEGCLFPLPHM